MSPRTVDRGQCELNRFTSGWPAGSEAMQAPKRNSGSIWIRSSMSRIGSNPTAIFAFFAPSRATGDGRSTLNARTFSNFRGSRFRLEQTSATPCVGGSSRCPTDDVAQTLTRSAEALPARGTITPCILDDDPEQLDASVVAYRRSGLRVGSNVPLRRCAQLCTYGRSRLLLADLSETGPFRIRLSGPRPARRSWRARDRDDAALHAGLRA